MGETGQLSTSCWWPPLGRKSVNKTTQCNEQDLKRVARELLMSKCDCVHPCELAAQRYPTRCYISLPLWAAYAKEMGQLSTSCWWPPLGRKSVNKTTQCNEQDLKRVARELLYIYICLSRISCVYIYKNMYILIYCIYKYIYIYIHICIYRYVGYK